MVLTAPGFLEIYWNYLKILETLEMYLNLVTVLEKSAMSWKMNQKFLEKLQNLVIFPSSIKVPY